MLLVDDEASVRMSTAARPDDRGCEVVEAALMMAGAEVFDLFVIDLPMPGKTGSSSPASCVGSGRTR